MLQYIKGLSRVLALIAAIASVQLMALEPQLVEGRHYLKLAPRISQSPMTMKLRASHKHADVQVLEFFGYGCYGCSQLQPYMHKWAAHKPKGVEIQRIPVVFHRGWDVLAKAFYTAQVLDRLHQMDAAFFQAIIRDHRNLSDIEQLKHFFQDFGIESAQFDSVYYSFEVERRFNQSRELTRNFEVMATPAVVVTGPRNTYLIDVPMVGSEQALIAALPKLIEMART